MWPNTTRVHYGRGGDAGVVRILLERENINPKTRCGRTPLLWAAQIGHAGIAMLLLARADLNPDTPGFSGETALELDASQVHSGVL